MSRPVNMVLAATRAGWGLALITIPGRLISLAGGRDIPRARTVARVLGARHLAQASLVASGWRPALWPLGPAADVAHAASAAAFAALEPGWRRVGEVDTGLALAFAASPLFTLL